jgi:hypothetical protein
MKPLGKQKGFKEIGGDLYKAKLLKIWPAQVIQCNGSLRSTMFIQNRKTPAKLMDRVRSITCR